ncbi:molybdenum cofactor guanylyltransferase [Mariniblastus fucicola]|uniref:Molybdopterin-guanine dinucleotide biosynthesis protein MobA n=1 Tax=Mariniblastus fucicola TaxID=980251 RepID=A0A5B9P531_9BACT|nr:molybdenum cofactor guanylyltransferase [Mariniblastus fucicola]QEG21707.1 molybdopterin-guanine dinucleotide biosynthesis protein MobA [Mariniblastus fucicola]
MAHESERPFEIAAIVLCGGESSRMGFDKFRLPLGDRTFLECVVSELLNVVDGPIIAAASKRTLEEVTKIRDQIGVDRFSVVVDQRDDSGPLEGIRVGLEAAGKCSRWAFVTSCDVPLICPAVLNVLQDALLASDMADVEAAIPMTTNRIYGMTAIYRCSAAEKVAAMIERKQLRVSDLAKELKTQQVNMEQIRAADPELDSMKNLNSPSQYLDFLRGRGLDCPASIEELLRHG